MAISEGKWYFAAAVVTTLAMVGLNLYMINRTGQAAVPIRLSAKAGRKPWRR